MLGTLGSGQGLGREGGAQDHAEGQCRGEDDTLDVFVMRVGGPHGFSLREGQKV